MKPGAAKRDSGGVARRVASRASPTLRLSRGLQSVRSLMLLQQQSFSGGVTIKKHLLYRRGCASACVPRERTPTWSSLVHGGKLFTCNFMMLGKVVQQNARG